MILEQCEKMELNGTSILQISVPEGWELRLLGELATIFSGGTPNRKNPEYWDGDIPWVTTTLIDGGEIFEANELITQKGLEGSSAKWCKAGTILMAMYGQGKTRGKVALLGIDATINQACAAIELSESCSREYVLHLLISKYEHIRELSNSGGQENLSGGIIKHLEILLPPQKEQIIIANVLSDTNALITALEKLITKKQAIKSATMQHLLTGRTRLPQFAQYPNGTLKNYKSSELGLIPEDWEVARLAQVAKVIDPHPSHRAPPEESYGVPFVGIGDLNESGELINSEVRRVNQSILQEHSERYSLHNRPIGLGRVASIGKVIRLLIGKEPYAISPTLGVIDGFACTNDFLFYYLKSESVTEQFGQVMSGSTRSSVGMNVLKEILVVKISSEEQISIAGILSDMDAEIGRLKQKLSKIRDIKQGMMQQLLTGRIRLPLDHQL